jgi:hypothetical protein
MKSPSGRYVDDDDNFGLKAFTSDGVPALLAQAKPGAKLILVATLVNPDGEHGGTVVIGPPPVGPCMEYEEFMSAVLEWALLHHVNSLIEDGCFDEGKKH